MTAIISGRTPRSKCKRSGGPTPRRSGVSMNATGAQLCQASAGGTVGGGEAKVIKLEGTSHLITCPASSLWARRHAKCIYQRAARRDASQLRPRV